ncbi:MAG: hypothetical protein KAG66_21575 [Methylococcales bacterium]|nr:hypothetical protein [Methylococcales bacterium]
MAKVSELETWVVYASPLDFPGQFVTRLFKGETPTGRLFIDNDLGAVRDYLEMKGLVCLPRFPEDDPTIVEVWL